MSITRAAKAASVLLAAAAMPVAVNAQDDLGNDQVGRADDRAVRDDVILVTARKVSENLQDVPLAISAIGGADLERRAVTEITDVTRVVPNVFFTQSPSNPQSLTLAIRGQRQNDILLTVDPSVGIYVDGLYYPRTHGLRGALVDIARVEVLRGPQGTLYGRNTTGGAMSIISNDPTDELGASLQASYGNYDAWELVGIANLPVSETMALRLVAQHRERDGYGSNFAGEDLADETSTFLRGKLRWDISDYVTATLSGSYSRARTAGPIVKLAGLAETTPPGGIATLEAAAELGLPLTPAGLAEAAGVLASYIGGDPYQSFVLGDTSSLFEGYNAGLTIDAEVTDTLSFRSITGYQHQERANSSDADATPLDILYATRLTPFVEYFSQEFQFLGDHDRFDWVAGLYLGYEKGQEFSPSISLPMLSATNPSVTDADVENIAYAAFAQGTYDLSDRLRLTLGARYSIDERKLVSRNTTAGLCAVPALGVETTTPGAATSRCPRTFKEDFSDVSWLASLDYEIADSVLVYGKVARGYRSGGINLRGRNTIESFSPFDAETVTEYEAGVKSELFDRLLQLNLAAYYDDYRDIQRSASVATTAGPQTFVNNAAEGTIKGVEAEAVLRPALGLTIQGSVGLTDAEYDEFLTAAGDRSDESFGVPEWTGSLSATYVRPLSVGDLTFQAGGTYRSEVELVPETTSIEQLTQGEYVLLNARISLDIEAAGLEIAVFGRNLTDKTYYDAGSNLEDILGYNYKVTGEPRTYGISLKKRFGAF